MAFVREYRTKKTNTCHWPQNLLQTDRKVLGFLDSLLFYGRPSTNTVDYMVWVGCFMLG